MSAYCCLLAKNYFLLFFYVGINTLAKLAADPVLDALLLNPGGALLLFCPPVLVSAASLSEKSQHSLLAF